jgi:serine/threonine-protein kinase
MPSPVLTAPPATRAAFLATLRAAELLSPAQLARVEATLPPTTTPGRAAEALVTAGVLTKFQADRLLAGRTDGFHLGPYVIQEQIGRGATGKVFRAKHRMMNRPVAVKVLPTELTQTPGTREVLQREVRAAAQLNHENIVSTYDASELGERFYLVLEFVDGANLDTLVAERGPLPIAEASEIIRQAALGLDHAHGQGVLHRNVKPSNLLVARPSASMPGPVVKIADFGVAKVSPAENLDYVAPEQAHNPLAADRRADLYSLGAVLYFLLAGRPLFPDAPADQKVQRHLWDEPTRVERLRGDVPPALAALVHQLLSKTPDARPASAAEVAERLGAFTGTAGLDYLELTPTARGVPNAAASETSPWEEITVVNAPGLDRVRDEEQPRPVARESGNATVSTWMLGGLAAGMLLTCIAAIGFIVRIAGK